MPIVIFVPPPVPNEASRLPASLTARLFREWPREESNLRTQIRSLPLYPLSYGAGVEDGSRSPVAGPSEPTSHPCG